MSEQTQIPEVHIHQDNRIYSIIGTLLLCGSIGMTAWAMAKNGWLEIAATMVTMFLVQLAKLLIDNGLIELPKAKDDEDEDFKVTSNFLRNFAHEFRVWQKKSPLWRLAFLAAAYTLVFMLARWGMSQALLVFTNIWIAGAAAALLGALIIAPEVIAAPFRKIKSKKSA